jgi:hypothetical protein
MGSKRLALRQKFVLATKALGHNLNCACHAHACVSVQARLNVQAQDQINKPTRLVALDHRAHAPLDIAVLDYWQFRCLARWKTVADLTNLGNAACYAAC